MTKMPKNVPILSSVAAMVLMTAVAGAPALAQQNSRWTLEQEMQERAETRALNLHNVRGFVSEPSIAGGTYADDEVVHHEDPVVEGDVNYEEDIVFSENLEPLAAPVPPARRGYDALWRLDRVADGSDRLFNMRVEDINGFTVGRFRRMEIRNDGERVAVVTLRGMRTVSLFDDHIRYDPNREILVTALTIDDIDYIPSGPAGSSPGPIFAR
jgi:hypothetical protein